MDAELEKILNDLKPSHKPGLNMPISTLQPTISSQPVQRLTSDRLDDFVLQNASNIVQDGVDMIKDLKNAISQTIDPDEVSSLADLIKATNGSLEILNKLNITNKKLGVKSNGKIINSGNTNVFIGTREDALKTIMNKKDSIDVECVELEDPPQIENEKE